MRRTLAVLGVAALVAVSSGGGVAVANHVFSDVPADSAHHDSIASVKGAGIATGFDDGTFRPRDPVTRGQFASWTVRGGGRVTQQHGGIVAENTNVEVVVASVQMTAGATGGAEGGFVHVSGSLDAVTNDHAACPCLVRARAATAAGAISSPDRYANIPAGGNEAGQAAAALSVDWVFPIDPDFTATFSLRARFVDANVDNVVFTGDLVATYIPFGPDGGNDL